MEGIKRYIISLEKLLMNWMKNIYSGSHPSSKLGIVALVAMFSLLIFWVLTFVLVIPLFGKEVFSDLISMGLNVDESQIGLYKFLQLTQSIGLFIVPSIILAMLFGGRVGEYLQLKRKPFMVSVLLAIVIIFSVSPLINVIGVWNSELSLPQWLSGVERWMRQSEDSAEELTKLFVNTKTIPGLLFNIFLIGIIPAIGEELLFRGIIQRIFSEWTKNKHIAIWITAILFSALHLQFYGFFPRALLGAMFGYLLIWSGNLWLPVLAHFVNNTTAVIAYFLYNNGTIHIDPDKIGTYSENGIAAIISAVFLTALFWIYYQFENRKALKV